MAAAREAKAPSHRLQAGLVFGLALAVLILAWPRLMSNLSKLPGTPGMSQLYGEQPIAVGAYDRIAGSRWSALGWVEDPLSWTDLGITYAAALRAWRGPIDADFASVLTQAQDAFRAGLRVGPAQPDAWARLALLEAGDGQPEAAAKALEASFRFAHYLPEMVLLRVALCLGLPMARAGGIASSCDNEFRYAAAADPVFLATRAVATNAVGRVAPTLAETPELAAAFDGGRILIHEPTP